MSVDIVSSYLSRVLNPVNYKKTIKLLVRELTKIKIEYDTIVFRGNSGALVGGALAAELNKQMLLVRKEKDNSHSSYRLEGYYELERYIIVDDLICSGNTIKEIVSDIKTHVDRKRRKDADLKCVGVITYFDPNDGVSYKPNGYIHDIVRTILNHDDFFLKGIYTKIKD